MSTQQLYNYHIVLATEGTEGHQEDFQVFDIRKSLNMKRDLKASFHY